MLKKMVILLLVIAVLPCAGFAENYDVKSFRDSLSEIDTTEVAVYRIKLEKIICTAESEGLGVEDMMKAALAEGVPPAALTSAAVKCYPIADVVKLAILGGGDTAEIINIAMMSGGDPAEIEAGSVSAGVDPVEAATLVNAAKNLLLDSGEGLASDSQETEDGLALTPGEALDADALPAPAAVGPVGGDGAGFASES
jgi:hypothetical protein